MSRGTLGKAGLVAVVARLRGPSGRGASVTANSGRGEGGRGGFGVRLIDARTWPVQVFELSPEDWRALLPAIEAGCRLALRPGELPPGAVVPVDLSQEDV